MRVDLRFRPYLLSNHRFAPLVATMSSSQEINNTRFNKEASDWDANKGHVRAVEKAFEAIERYVPAVKDGSSKGTLIAFSNNDLVPMKVLVLQAFGSEC